MKSVIVTGASGNLGQAVINKFLTEGYHVTGTIVPADPVALSIAHTNFEAVTVDLMNEDASATCIDNFLKKQKQIDVAVLTVGGFATGKITDTTMNDINKQIRLNFETAYNIARPVFNQMMKQGSGRIFLIGSKPGLTMKNSKGMVSYGLAKSLIFRLAELMNDEAKDKQVITHVIIPSTIDTPQNRKSMPDADFTKWVKAEDIAAIIHFYCIVEAIREPLIKIYGDS